MNWIETNGNNNWLESEATKSVLLYLREYRRGTILLLWIVDFEYAELMNNAGIHWIWNEMLNCCVKIEETQIRRSILGCIPVKNNNMTILIWQIKFDKLLTST